MLGLLGGDGAMQKMMLKQIKVQLVKNGIKALVIKTDANGDFDARAFKEPVAILSVSMLQELKEINEDFYNRVVALNDTTNNAEG